MPLATSLLSTVPRYSCTIAAVINFPLYSLDVLDIRLLGFFSPSDDSGFGGHLMRDCIRWLCRNGLCSSAWGLAKDYELL
ncbi:hypothetical protein L2E82_36210 [Cichorium intybus]|uniref:Uncharacterized protein n=1 Tax=Cichorium intybus TaxID=13427 RepID=A0ACB9BR48_CICIN|nr:hypothetical protein L2E82_36210 [Cichorium intybus]